MTAPKEIIDLVERFDRNREAYQSGKYNETQLRREFIDPFFKALGWDVDNTAGHAEAYKDVIHEDAIKVGSATKAPDYSFRIGGTRKFFVEAKKPSVNIAEGIEPAYQLRRYAWSAKLPLSILTDFEEFVVYDCRIKPDKSDKASTARIMYLNDRDYFARLAALEEGPAVLELGHERVREIGPDRGERTLADVAERDVTPELVGVDVPSQETQPMPTPLWFPEFISRRRITSPVRGWFSRTILR